MTGGTERIDELLRECARESFDEELSGLPEIPAGFSAAHELRMRGLFVSRGRPVRRRRWSPPNRRSG